VKLARFNALLDAYGAAPERWPERERADALLLARSSVTAARALAQARILDDALQTSSFPDIAAEPGRFVLLQSRILAAAHPIAKSWFGRLLGVDIPRSQLLPSLASLAVATVLGFAVGISGLMQADIAKDSDDTLIGSTIEVPVANGSQ